MDQYVDLLFFNRDLNCLVAVELKRGPFKTAYLGQLSGCLRVLDDYERREHENPSIGLVLCKDMNRVFVDYIIQDYNEPMGVATYKTSADMSSELLDAIPPIDDLKALLEGDRGLITIGRARLGGPPPYLVAGNEDVRDDSLRQARAPPR